MLGEVLKQGVDALDVLDPLQKLAQRHGASLDEIVKRAVDALERDRGLR